MPDLIVEGRKVEQLSSFLLDIVKPYRNKYLAKRSDGEWYQSPRYLSDAIIRRALWGPGGIGFFQATVTRVVGLDIDDHTGKGWTDPKSAALLWYIYSGQVRERLPAASVLCHSPRGLHAYWVFDIPLPGELVFPLLRERLKNIEGVEVRPTLSEALRLPTRRLIDPVTGKPLEELRLKAVYSPEDVLGRCTDPTTVRRSLAARKGSLSAFTRGLAIERIEEQWTPFVDGTSNEALKHLVPVYRSGGLSAEEAAQRIEERLSVSAGYSAQGELRNPARLRKRIASFYRNSPVRTQRPAELSAERRQWVESLVAIHPWAAQRTKPLRRFLEDLGRWLAFHDSVLRNPGQLALFRYLYPYYEKNRREGYYPLPKAVLRKWNHRCHEIMTWLRDIGALVPAPYRYAPNQGICRYYRPRLLCADGSPS